MNRAWLGSALIALLGAVPAARAACTVDRLFFDSNRTGNHEIYVMNVDGTGVTPLTSDPSYETFWARVSPDGEKVLFYRTPPGVGESDFGQAALWLMNADGTGQRLLRAAGIDGWALQAHAEWSPDGSQMVMMGGTPGTGIEIQITDGLGRNPMALTNLPGIALDPSWSPDGRRVVFTHSATLAEADQEVYVVASTGGALTRLTTDGRRDNDPYFSPDGASIAWLVQTDTAAYGGIGIWNIFKMTAAGAAQTNLTNDAHINSRPEWSADGRKIYFHRLETGRMTQFNLFSMNADGTGLAEINPGAPGVNEYPSYSVCRPSAEADGRTEAARVYPNHVRDFRPGGSQVTFDRLPADAVIDIYTVAWEKVLTLSGSDVVGGQAVWRFQNGDGAYVASGVYLCVITDGRGGKTVKRVILAR